MKKTLVAALMIAILAFSVCLVACNNDEQLSVDDVVTLKDIEIVSQPTKLEYNEGDVLDLTGLKVNAVYSDNSKKDVTDKVTTNLGQNPLKASNKSFFVIYKETIDGKTITKNKSISITVIAEEVIHPEVIKDYNPTSAELPHNVIKTSTAAMLFYTNYDSSSMKCESYLELTPDATDANKGTFVFAEMSGFTDKLYKLGKLTGTYVIEGDKMTLQALKLYVGTKADGETLLTGKYSDATKEVATIDKNGDAIVGLNFGKMSGNDKFWGWSKTKASSFVEGTATAHDLSADTVYMEVVNNNTMSDNMKSYYIVESATLDGIENMINVNGYFVGDKLNLPAELVASVKYSGFDTNYSLANNFTVNVKRGDELLAADVALEKGDKLVVTVDGVETSIDLDIKDVPVEKTLVGIEITTAPTKTEYKVGEKFDPAGMVVTAKYSTGDEDNVVIDDLSKLTLTIGESDYASVVLTADAVVTVSYTEGDVTVFAVGGQAITVVFNYVDPRDIATTSTANYTFVMFAKKATKQLAYATVELFGDMTEGQYQVTVRYTKDKWATTSKLCSLAYVGTYSVADGKIVFAAPFFISNTDKNTTMWYNDAAKALEDEDFKTKKENVDQKGITADIVMDGDNIANLTFDRTKDDVLNSFFLFDSKENSAACAVVCYIVNDHVIPEEVASLLPTLPTA